MLKPVAIAVTVALFLTGCVSTAGSKKAARIDGSSPEAAVASYEAMMRGRSEEERKKLALAIVVLNMEDVQSGYEVVGNPELESPSIARIRKIVAGMTAEEIWVRAAQSPTIRIESARQ